MSATTSIPFRQTCHDRDGRLWPSPPPAGSRTGLSAAGLASLHVITLAARVADGLATAAFILSLEDGTRLLGQSDVGGAFITPSGEIHRTTPRG